jgi:hypothetical protein
MFIVYLYAVQLFIWLMLSILEDRLVRLTLFDSLPFVGVCTFLFGYLQGER